MLIHAVHTIRSDSAFTQVTAIVILFKAMGTLHQAVYTRAFLLGRYKISVRWFTITWGYSQSA